MENKDLLNKETSVFLEDYEKSKRFAVSYLIFSITLIMCLMIFSVTTYREAKLLKGKAHNDSLAFQSLKNNLLKH